MRLRTLTLRITAARRLGCIALGGVGVWMLLSGLFGAWVYFGPRPPELGYYGFFYVFELVGSLFYFGALVCVLALLALIGFVLRRGMATTAQHGFEVHAIAGKDAA